MEYQILALDLDGTLTNSKKEISRPTLEALIDIQEQGKKVVLASGRPTKGVLPLAKQLHLEDYGSYILSFNGARITDCRSMQAIYNKTLPGDIVEPLLQILRKYDGLIFCLIQQIISSPESNRTNIPNWNPGSITCRSSRRMILRQVLKNRRTSFL